MTIKARIETSRVRADIESNRPIATIESNRVRVDIEIVNYLNRNYVIVFDDYFAEDYVVEF